MDIVNRGYIMVRPNQPFFDWVKVQEPELSVVESSEPTIYLIDEDFFEDERVLAVHFKEIFRAELSGVTEDESAFPEITWEVFQKWFEVELGTTVLDCLSMPLSKES